MRFRVILIRESASRSTPTRRRIDAGDVPNDLIIDAPFINPKPRARFRRSQ
jgi:hypothetical protein